MAYVDYEFYKTIYGDTMPETDFNRLEYESRRKVDNLTFGKLKFAFPTDEDAIEAVCRCVCKLINIAWQIETAEKRISDAKGYEVNQDGSLRGKIVTSVSSGSESVSYTAKTEQNTLIDTVLTDKAAQERLYCDTVKEHLSMVADSNGVNLLYAGIPYPYPNAPISKPPEFPQRSIEPEPEPPKEPDPEIPTEPQEPEVPPEESEGVDGA